MSVERFMRFGRDKVKYLPILSLSTCQLDVLAQSSAQVKTIVELINRFKATMQLKALETRLYLRSAVDIDYSELRDVYHPGTAMRALVRISGTLTSLGFECLNDLPEAVTACADCDSVFNDGSTMNLLKEISEHATAIIPIVISLQKWTTISFKAGLSEEALRESVARLKGITQSMIRALEAINLTLREALGKFTVVEFDKFVTRLFQTIPLNDLVSVMFGFIIAFEEKTELRYTTDFNFSTRLAPVAAFVPLDRSAGPAAGAPLDKILSV